MLMTSGIHHSTGKRRFIQTVLLALCSISLTFQDVKAAETRPSAPEIATPVLTGSAANGARYMMVTAHPEATKVGARILNEGGSAADAAIAAQLVLGLVEPQSSGIGGGGFALYYDAQARQVYGYDGRETAPATAGKYLFTGEDGKPMPFYDAAVGGRSVGVPGTVRLLELLHTKHGVKPWRDLFSPAILLSEAGFQVTPRLAAMVAHDAGHLKIFTPSALYYFPDVTNPLVEGARRDNVLYARILRRIAMEGANAFYNGENPEAIVKAVREDRENPGLLSIEDFANYHALVRDALCLPYRGYRVCTVGEPSGGLTLLIALGILSEFDLARTGPKSPESWHLIAEASRLAFADRDYYMADPHFASTPGKMLIDPVYLKMRAALISPVKAVQKVMPGTPPQWKKLLPAAEPAYPKPPGTTQIVAIDVRGNAVSMTSSIEDMFGSRMMVNGFMLNNQLTDFSFVPETGGKAVANRVEGGKRPRSSMAPVIVFDPSGAPFMVTGSAGGSAITGYVLQRIVSAIDWKMDPVAALAAPSIINRGKEIELEEGAAELAEPLRKFGHPVVMKELNSGLATIQTSGGRMTGAADPRREGTAMGE